MAHAGIADALDNPGKAFGGVVVTNGAGSPRTATYAHLSDAQMREVRREEQRTAGNPDVAADLDLIFRGCRPELVYVHNPADKHDTHIGVLLRCLDMLRAPGRAAPAARARLRSLARSRLARRCGQGVARRGAARGARGGIAQGLRFADYGRQALRLATLGRRAAHATFHTSHATDRATGITWSMDLTPLLHTPTLSLAEFAGEYIRRFHDDVNERIRRMGGG